MYYINVLLCTIQIQFFMYFLCYFKFKFIQHLFLYVWYRQEKKINSKLNFPRGKYDEHINKKPNNIIMVREFIIKTFYRLYLY